MAIKQKFRDNQSGSVVITVAIMLFVIMAILLFTIDLGKMQTGRSHLQDSADSAVIDAATWVSKTRENANPATIPNPSSWLPAAADLKQYMTNYVTAYYAKHQSYTTVKVSSIQTNAVVNATSTDISLSLCADVETQINKALRGNNTEEVCVNATSRIFPGGLRDKDIVIAYNADAIMSSWVTNGEFKSDMINGGTASMPVSIFNKYFKDSSTMQNNNLYVGLIPYTTFVNVYPYGPSFVQGHVKNNLQYTYPGGSGSHLQINVTGNPQNYEVMRDLGMDYPVFSDNDFNTLIDDAAANPHQVSTFKFPSNYSWMRYDQDPSDGNTKGRLYTTQYPALNDVTYTWVGAQIVPDNAHYMDDNAKYLLKCDYNMPRQAISDLYSNNFIQPLTNDFAAIQKNISMSNPSAGFQGSYCPMWGGNNTDYINLANALPTAFKNKYYECTYDITPATNGNPYLGILWGWMALSDSFKGKWSNQSVFEGLAGSSIDRTNIPASTAESGRDKVLIVMYSRTADTAGWGSRPVLCDSYQQFYSNYNDPNKAIATNIFDITTEYQAYSSAKPSNYATYGKLCDKLKAEGVEIFMINYDYDGYHPTVSEDKLAACATDSSHYYKGDLSTMGPSLSSVFSGLKTSNDRIVLVK